MTQNKALVIGGGLAGLAASVELVTRGFDVTIVDKNNHLGGKMNVLESNGYSFDMGPTILTIPDVLRDIISKGSDEPGVRSLERDIGRIVDLSLSEVAERAGFAARDVTVRAEPAARARLAQLGYHPEFGARPLKRVVEARVVTPIAIELAADPDLSGVTFEVVERGEDVEIVRR